MRNGITKRDGTHPNVNPRTRPRKFLFNIGSYDVAVKKKRSGVRCNYHYIHTQIWHRSVRVGYIDLTTSFADVRTVMSVHTMINQDYQGLGIAYRAYEGLVNETNIAISSDNQSPGAMKLWRRFPTNRTLRVYHVDNYATGRLFQSVVNKVSLNKDRKLEGIDQDGKPFDPYRRRGSLLLVRRKSPLDLAVQKHMKLFDRIAVAASDFKKYDAFKF